VSYRDQERKAYDVISCRDRERKAYDVVSYRDQKRKAYDVISCSLIRFAVTNICIQF